MAVRQGLVHRATRVPAGIALGILLASGCLDSNDPSNTGSIAIRFSPPSADAQSANNASVTHMDSVQVAVSGKTSKSVTLVAASGSTQITGTIDGLEAGPYTVDLTGYGGGVVVYHASASATVTAGAQATADAPLPSVTPFAVSTLLAA